MKTAPLKVKCITCIQSALKFVEKQTSNEGRVVIETVLYAGNVLWTSASDP